MFCAKCGGYGGGSEARVRVTGGLSSDVGFGFFFSFYFPTVHMKLCDQRLILKGSCTADRRG